ncbi:MAG: hypothetical protein ACRC14_02670 [Paracoccaceae bacterium]
MSFTVEIPVANLATARATLAGLNRGPNNFNVPLYTTAGGVQPVLACIHHIGTDAAFRAQCVALPGAVVRDYAPLTVSMDATATAAGARWGSNAPLLQGAVTPGLYRATVADGGALWTVIQAFNRTTFNLPLNTPTNPYPALLTQARTPGEVTIWVQPLGAFDAYRPVNVFSGQPDRVTHLGQTWRCTQGDGAGNNVFEPGVFGWVQE